MAWCGSCTGKQTDAWCPLCDDDSAQPKGKLVKEPTAASRRGTGRPLSRRDSQPKGKLVKGLSTTAESAASRRGFGGLLSRRDSQPKGKLVKGPSTPTESAASRRGFGRLPSISPGAAPAAALTDDEVRLWQLMQRNIKRAMSPGGFLSPGSQGGALSEQQKQVKAGFLSVVISEDIMDNVHQLKRLFYTVTGSWTYSARAALAMRQLHDGDCSKQLASVPRRRARKNAADPVWIRNYFHTQSPLVSLDKTKTYIFKGRQKHKHKHLGFTLEGCRPMRLAASPDEVAKEMVQSKAYADHLAATGRVALSFHTARRYICPCMW